MGNIKKQTKTKTAQKKKHQDLIKWLYNLGNVSFDKPSNALRELCLLRILRGAKQSGKTEQVLGGETKFSLQLANTVPFVSPRLLEPLFLLMHDLHC